jgi:hypothetical protein
MTMPLQCRKCLPPARQLGTYLAIVFVTVLFVAVTVRFTWQDNKENDNSLRPSDLVKVLVSYLQYMVIISTISVPWPAFLVTLYASATVVFGAASGQALSLDCLLQHYGVGKDVLPIAIQRQLVYFLAAVGNYVSVALLLYAGHLAKRAWHAISTRGAGASAVSGSSKRFDGTKCYWWRSQWCCFSHTRPFARQHSHSLRAYASMMRTCSHTPNSPYSTTQKGILLVVTFSRSGLGGTEAGHSV